MEVTNSNVFELLKEHSNLTEEEKITAHNHGQEDHEGHDHE